MSTIWLTGHGLSYEFHDFKKKGVTVEELNRWCDFFGWENVLNKKGTTYKKLTFEQQAAVFDQGSAVVLMVANPSSIKRPIVEVDKKPVLIGFREEAYVLAFK